MRGSIDEITGFIGVNRQFTLISHVSPDGDTLGSGLALMGMLRGLGREAELVCCDPVPRVYRFLPGAGDVKLPEDAAGFPAVITVDCSDRLRLGGAARLFDGAEHTACIDHHVTNAGFAQANWVEEAAAAGELVFRIAGALNAEITGDMADCLFAALMTDTGCFAYANVTPDTMRTAGSLMDRGADNARLNRLIYHMVPVSKARLHARAMSGLTLYDGGRIAAAGLTEEDISSVGGLEEYAEGIVEDLRDIDTVEIAVFLRQRGDDVKVSLRTRECADAARMAAERNGGGHARAAGYTEYGRGVREAENIAVALAREELSRCGKA